MKRFIDLHLQSWMHEQDRKPLLLRGARQVGKTFAVRNLGKNFASYVEINCEELEAACTAIFEKDLKADRILTELSLLAGETIIPGATLLFIDEIQVVPRAILALRYFYEKIPKLHVIAAGSLIEFAIEKVGIPVGRIDSFYLYPMSWVEFLLAKGEDLLCKAILEHNLNTPLSETIHKKSLGLLGEYFALGGMPKVVAKWVETKDPHLCFKVQRALVDDYKQDFEKYAKRHEIKYVEILFAEIPRQLGRKFQFKDIPGDYRKRELAPCFDLLVKAGVVHPVFHTSAQGLPLGAQTDLNLFKAVFLDIGLAQAVLGLDLKEWFLNPNNAFINQGNIVEAFVGQEIIAYSHIFQKKELYYWHKEARTGTAEIDYVLQLKQDIIPIEVKSGATGTLKSLGEFFKNHPACPYAIRFSGHNYSEYNNLHSYPLYAIANVLGITL